MSISSCTFPDCWKMSNVSPIPKGGDSHCPSNYRPISLLSVLSKTFERHICSLISDRISISDNQWGFLPGKSTTGAVLSALYDWEGLLDKNLEVLVAFLDIRKAFDSVPHKCLLERLLSLDVPEHIVGLISSYLYDRSQQVCVNGSTSSKCHVTSGVPQGSVLGPLLFILYVDKLTSVKLSNGTVILYADDICLYRPVFSEKDRQAFQQDIDNLVSAIGNLGLNLNTRKCKIMLLSRRKAQPLIHFTILNTSLEQVSSYCYLGFLITSNLSWSLHIHHCCTRARKHLGLIYRQFYKAGANMATLKALYIAHVCPILEYEACIWDPHLQKDIDCIERVQKLASKMCTRNWSLPYDQLQRLSLLNLLTLSFRRKIIKICFLYKMLNGLSAPPFPLTTINHSYNTRSHDLSLCTSYAHSYILFLTAQSDCGIIYPQILHMLPQLIPLNQLFKNFI